MSRYNRRIHPVNLVDFSQPHDENDYLHYSFSVFKDGRKITVYESREKSTKSIVYQGNQSYWERKDQMAYNDVLLRRKTNYREIAGRRKTDEEEEEESYVKVTPDDLLQKKMIEILTSAKEETETNN